MRTYKFLTEGGAGRFSGFAWPQPEGDQPGAWVSAEGSVSVCRTGVHACRVMDLLDWIDDELWEIELAGEVTEEPSMLVGERGRLLRRIDSWDTATASALADDCAWRARTIAVRAFRRDGLAAEADRLEAVGDLFDMQIVAALASRRPEAASATAAAFAADAVALARGQRPETWDLAVALADPAPAQTPAATAANLAYVVAHAAGLDAVAETDDEASYASGFAAERAWQLRWLSERLAL
jgi:hypothetical protein